ncbi:MAG: hypothetical protein KGI04_01115 [Candidatus Micrarchaeota archaeon]|nr:hypothetical protein [Candidatus Micrarchaeota archaeon]
MRRESYAATVVAVVKRYAKIMWLLLMLFSGKSYAAAFSFDIIGTLTGIQNLLAHLGPVLSAVLFIVAGIFYAIGQLFPATKRANFHSTAIDILVGAIIVAVLSVASNGLALASTHLLTNITNVSV